MKLTFLGTGTSAGVPMIACGCEVCTSQDPKDQRLRTSALIEDGDTVLCIDTGPDFRQQMLREGVTKLDAVLLTHSHIDHTGGLDDIRAFNFRLRKEIDVHLDPYVEEMLRLQYHYIFNPEPYPGIPRLQLHHITGPFDVEGTPIVPIRVMHHNLPVNAFRIRDLTYITDANFIEEAELEKAMGSKVLVVNALRREPHISHFTLDEALKIIDRVKPERAYLTHISHRLGRHAEIQSELPDGVQLAYDGLTVELS